MSSRGSYVSTSVSTGEIEVASVSSSAAPLSEEAAQPAIAVRPAAQGPRLVDVSYALVERELSAHTVFDGQRLT